MKPPIEAPPVSAALTNTRVRRPTWEQVEGSPLPLGACWIQTEQAFNFAVHAEHAESVTLLLYRAADLVNPAFTYRFDFLRNKSGRIWHCRIPLSEMGDARYYAYSVSGEGEASSPVYCFDHIGAGTCHAFQVQVLVFIGSGLNVFNKRKPCQLSNTLL